MSCLSLQVPVLLDGSAHSRPSPFVRTSAAPLHSPTPLYPHTPNCPSRGTWVAPSYARSHFGTPQQCQGWEVLTKHLVPLCRQRN